MRTFAANSANARRNRGVAPRIGRAADHDGACRRGRKGGAATLKGLFTAALVIGAGAVVYQALPDIRRYLRIRKM